MTLHRKPLLATIALFLGLAAGCSTDSPNSPTAPPVNPVPPTPPGSELVVSITPETSTLEAGSTDFVTLVVRATRGGALVSGLTTGTISTTLGSFGSVGGPQTLNIELVNGQATVVVFPGDAIGTANVRAQVSSSVDFATISIQEAGTPDTFFLSSVSPSTGSPQGGDVVTIHGGGFSDPIRVTFDGVTAVVQSATATTIRVVTPPFLGGVPVGETRAVTVSVTINLNEPEQATDSLASGFVYVNGGSGILQPQIFSVTPSSGPNEGGTQVTINGDGFEAPVAVDFGEGTATQPFVSAQIVSVTRTRIVVLSPAASGFGQGNLNGLISIRVTNQGSGRTTTATDSFRYGTAVRITSIAPGEGPATGGTLVTVFGQGFDEPVAVSMGNHAQQVISVSGSEIVIRTVPIVITGCSDVSGATSVTNIETGDSATGPSFTYRVPRPTIFAIQPSSGPQAGNTLVTVTGSGFTSNMLVEFSIGGATLTGNVQSRTSTTITVRTPAIPNAAFDTEVCDDNGNPIPPDPTPDPDGERYLSTSATVRVTDPATGCTATLSNVFLFIPSDTSCRGD
jgi:hypothetical protein